MHYDQITFPSDSAPVATNPLFQHLIDTYVSEANKLAGLWRAIPDRLLDYKPHEKMNDVRTILAHQLLSERRFFAQFVGTIEPPAETLLPASPSPPVIAYLEKYIDQVRNRLPRIAAGTAQWWQQEVTFFGQRRQRIWTFWRRVLHTAHHRTQLQMYLRLAGEYVPAIYGPSGDVKWDDADPTYSVEAAKRG